MTGWLDFAFGAVVVLVTSAVSTAVSWSRNRADIGHQRERLDRHSGVIAGNAERGADHETRLRLAEARDQAQAGRITAIEQRLHKLDEIEQTGRETLEIVRKLA